MGSVLQTTISVSLAERSIEEMLFSKGLEEAIGSRELANRICENKSIALVEQLSEYARKYPQSRKVVVDALDLAQNCDCSKVIGVAKRRVSEILALEMIEALSSTDLY